MPTDQFNVAVNNLKQQYVTEGPFYLSNFYKQDGPNQLFNFLQSAYQSVYQNNFRIIIVQDCDDVYDYQDLPGQAICTLQKYISQLDISNFFVLLVTGNANIDTELEQARTLYSIDVCKINSYLVKAEDPKKNYQTQDTFCVLPWMHLYVGPDANILPCCVADTKFPLGNIAEHNIDDIFKSPRLDKLRSNMIIGQRSKECKRCYDQEDSGLPSSRIKHNRDWPQITKQTVDPTGSINTFKPMYLDLRLNNTCNLKCRMCNGYFSSAIAQEEIELFGDLKSINSSTRLKQRKQHIGEIIKYLPFVEKIYFAGGEPMLASEHYDLLDALIECGNTDLEIVYSTNFTTLKYRDRSVLDLWQHFSNITVGASLDAHGAVAEYVRHGTNWATIEENLQILKTKCPHIKFLVTSTVGLLNVISLAELQYKWHSTNTLDLSNFSQAVMIGPPHLTVVALPLEHKKRVGEVIDNHIRWCQNHGADKLATQWHNVLTYMWSSNDTHYAGEFKRLTQIMDQYRNESLIHVLPEFKNLL